MLEPKNETDHAVIMEFKVRDSRGEASKGIPGERIRKYGFAFEGKEVLIKSF